LIIKYAIIVTLIMYLKAELSNSFLKVSLFQI
jgi:hypothetical protein